MARDTPWTWTWQAYPGVWIVVVALVSAYTAAVHRAAAPPTLRRGKPAQVASFCLGIVALWIAADWPIGALGAGYLASVHTAQFILFTLVAPPLLLLGMPRWLLEAMLARLSLRSLARALTHPLLALAVFAVTLVATHLPPVVDVFKRTQLGSFAFDMAWLGAGLVMWWPAVLRVPDLRPLSYPVRIGYLALTAIVSIAPSAFLTFADYPLYALYELAPRVAGISAAADQQAAGLIMNVAGGLIVIGAMTVLFFRWQMVEEAEEQADRAARASSAT